MTEPGIYAIENLKDQRVYVRIVPPQTLMANVVSDR